MLSSQLIDGAFGIWRENCTFIKKFLIKITTVITNVCCIFE